MIIAAGALIAVLVVALAALVRVRRQLAAVRADLRMVQDQERAALRRLALARTGS